MPSHLLGKKSWNVYNPANIERVKRDEAEAQVRAEAEEKRQQGLEAERRLAILRGEVPPALPTPPSPPPSTATGTHRKRERDGDDGSTATFRGGERRKRKRFGEDDTDFEMRVARERTAPTNTTTTTQLHKTSDAPLVDSRGHISLFPEEGKEKGKGRDTSGNEKNEDAEREAADKRREFEDQYTMRFANAAGRGGVGVTGSGPWYASNGAGDSRESAETQPGKDAFGRDDPKRKDRDAARVVANDPLAMMKRGAAKARDVERERRALNEEKAKELKQLRKEEKRREKRRRHHNDVDELEGFCLDAHTRDGDDRKRERGSREHRSGSRDRDKDRHRRRSDHGDHHERHHRHHNDHRHESRGHQGHNRGDRDDRERHSSGRSRRDLAKTDHY
ncbi:hypothetical protein GGR51DRAFT_501465 [Nemania sp. FL0031]|nr:hypothetical protein GGR51DRAFT_501465 [Nemania sp. FL0031]